MKKVTLIILLLFLVTLSGVSAYGYFIYIPQKVEERIVSNFSVFGFEDFSYGSITHKSGHIIISDIALDKGKFSTIDQMDISVSLLKYLINPTHAQNIVVRGMKLTGEIRDDNQVSISGWENHAKLLRGLQSFPAGTIVFDQSSIDLLTNSIGGLSMKYDARASITSSGMIEFKAKIDSKQKKLTFHSNIEGSLTPQGELSFSSKIEDIGASFETLSLRRGLGEFQAEYPAFQENPILSMQGEFQFPSIRWHDLPLRDTKLTLSRDSDNYDIVANGTTFGDRTIQWSSAITPQTGTITSDTTLSPENLSDVIDFIETHKKLKLKAEIPDTLRNLKKPIINVVNTIDLNASKNVGTLKLSIPKPALTINADYRSATDLNTLLGTITLEKTTLKSSQSRTDDTRFNVSAFGEFTVKNFATNPQIDWFIHADIIDGLLDFEAMTIPNIKGSVFIGKKNNKKTRSNTYLPFTLPLKKNIAHKGRIGINLDDKDKPLLGHVILQIYNGVIKTEAPIFQNGKIVRKNKLVVTDLNISKLMQDAGFSNVTITGALGGIIPFETVDSEVKVNGALIQSLRPGVLSLPKDVIMGLFPGNTPKMIMIREALENYHYEFFEIRFDGDLADRVMMTVSAQGQNPEMARKDPVDLNLQIETQISLLFQGLRR